MPQKTDNIWISLIGTIYEFFISAWHSILGLLRGEEKMKEGTYKNLNALIKEIPHSWANHPTGIGIGRSTIVAILYLLEKHVYFHEKK